MQTGGVNDQVPHGSGLKQVEVLNCGSGMGILCTLRAQMPISAFLRVWHQLLIMLIVHFGLVLKQEKINQKHQLKKKITFIVADFLSLRDSDPA